MEKKKKPNWFFRILSLLFIIYISLTIAMETGYYEAKLNEKTIMTTESMKQFEEDVRNGKTVDIKDYMSEKKTDYSNNTSKTGAFLSGIVEDFMTDGISAAIDIFKKLFT